ncbi:MAG: hypothetical protein Q4A60_05805 [Pasteurellaceae bacterium]|nr:hypothetical protein [Pasteurellaceae bacterium]
MSNQFRQARRNQRWRMNRQMQDRRRLNMFLVEKRVRQLEGHQEVLVLDLENTHDLIKALEIKVQGLLDEKKARQQAEKLIAPVVGVPTPPSHLVRFWRWLRDVLCSKGNP